MTEGENKNLRFSPPVSLTLDSPLTEGARADRVVRPYERLPMVLCTIVRGVGDAAPYENTTGKICRAGPVCPAAKRIVGTATGNPYLLPPLASPV